MIPLSAEDLEQIASSTIGHYDARAAAFWEGTRDHDVRQNIQALKDALPGPAPQRILDLGCGPGRDLLAWRALGHAPTGLDGSARFCEMARARSGCAVLHQSFLALDLPSASFEGIFANASLFHVPAQALPRVLRQLREALVPGGALFASNPRGDNVEGWNGARYGSYHDLPTWRGFLEDAGFSYVHHYYRPTGLPRAQQPWLASVWRRA